jgi:pentapeptide MXKDX repeat protein
MTTHSRFTLSLSVAALCVGFALAPAAYAQGMAPQGSTMANPSGTMAKPDTMGKTDSMGKTDTMAKPADKTDAMKKPDEMSDKKKDGMAK